MIRRQFLSRLVVGCASGWTGAQRWRRDLAGRSDSLIRSIETRTLSRNRDGAGTTWFHPRACMVPDSDGERYAMMCLQEITGSDYFGPVHFSESEDAGHTWTTPAPIPALGRIPVDGHEGLEAGVCDVVPQYHQATNTILALGHVVFYRGARFSGNDQLARYPVYAVRDASGSWGPRQRLDWDDPRGGFIYSNNCGQRVVEDDGSIRLAFTFGPESANRMVAGVECSFDGETLQVERVGAPLSLNVGRGLLEPSVIKYEDRYLMTIRAEDGRGYSAISNDGVDYEQMQAWAWDDGSEIEMSTTQQHWLAHSDGLFLIYTRRDRSNERVTRWRSPLWIAQVDLGNRTLMKSTEQIVLPLTGDGRDAPDDVALMGNFHITNVDAHTAWVTVGEWMPRRQARGDLLLAEIKWSSPNRIAD